MDQDKPYWTEWKNHLNRWGVKDWIATVLDYLGPFSILGAQFLLFSAPFLSVFLSKRQVYAISQMLDEPAQTKAFSEYLKET